MPRFDLIIEVNSGKAVASLTDPALVEVSLPPFVQDDEALEFRVHLIRATGPTTAPERIAVTGNDIQAALARKAGNTTEYYTQQFSWTASTDLANPYWQAFFPMNTLAIKELIGTATHASAWFAVKFFESGKGRMVFSQSVKVNAAEIKDDALIEPEDGVALSSTTANATYLKKSGNSEMILIDQTTGDKLRLWFENGILQQEVISA